MYWPFIRQRERDKDWRIPEKGSKSWDNDNTRLHEMMKQEKSSYEGDNLEWNGFTRLVMVAIRILTSSTMNWSMLLSCGCNHSSEYCCPVCKDWWPAAEIIKVICCCKGNEHRRGEKREESTEKRYSNLISVW